MADFTKSQVKALNEFQAVAQALAQQARRDIAASRLAALSRPIGEVRLDIDFNHPSDAKLPAMDYDFHAHGYHYKGRGVRWAVWRVRWDGDEWKHVRKLVGPLLYEPALTELTKQCARLGLERV